jgi:hypothetical protein
VNGDGLLDIATGWEESGVTRVYLHPGHDRAKSRWPAVTVGETTSVEDAVFADLDADGALDVVSCCEGKTRKVFVHWAPKAAEDLLDREAWQQEVIPASVGTMPWMYAWPMQVDGKNGVDIVAGGKRSGGALGWFEVPKKSRDVAAYRWHEISPVGWLMSIWKRDMDADGDVDLVVSDRYEALKGCRWLENPGPGDAQVQPWKNRFMGARDEEVLSMAMTDLDADGLEDALVAVSDFKLLYLRRLDSSGLEWETHEIDTLASAGNPRAVAVADVNLDGRLDIAMTTWNSDGLHGALWLECLGKPGEASWKFHPISGREKGIKYDRIELVDLDGDGDLDFLSCEEHVGGGGLGVFWYENPAVGGGVTR